MQTITIKFLMALACAGGPVYLAPAWAQAPSAPPAFSDGCPALGALQYACIAPPDAPARPANQAAGATDNGIVPAELLTRIFSNDATDPAIASHTPRQAQLLALALVEALQQAWARLPPYPPSGDRTHRPVIPAPSIATHNAQMLAAAMVGNALILNPCLDIDQKNGTPPAPDYRVGTTGSVCDPALQAVRGIGVAKLNMAFYDKAPGAAGFYEFPYYLDFYKGLNNWTGNQYRAGSFLDSVLYLGAFFTGVRSAQPLYLLKMPVNSIQMPLRRASPFGKALAAASVPLDDSTLEHAVDAFAAFQAVGIGSCLATSSAASAWSRDPCSHQCRVNAASRVLAWVRQTQAQAQPCAEPEAARARAVTAPAPTPAMML